MTPDQSGRHHARATVSSCLSVGIIRAAHASPSRIMPRSYRSPVCGRGGRRFGLSATHRSGAAPIGDLRRNLPGFASARRRPRPEERPPMSSQSRPSRSPARLDPWTLAALLSTPRPLPPRASLPPCASRSDQRPQFAGGQGLRSLPAVFAGARPARSHSLALTAVDCFPEPLHRGAAVLIGDTPRRTGAFWWLPISFGK